jgi:hypothetical protein
MANIFNKRPYEYVALAKPFLVLILAIGVLRLALSLAGVSNSATKWVSINAITWIGILYYAVKIQTSGFGSYRHLLPIVFLMQGVVAQAVIVTGILIAIFTGTDNIYSAPEYAFGGDGKTWLHAGSHLLIGAPIGTLVGWLLGCLIMFASTKWMAKEARLGALDQRRS